MFYKELAYPAASTILAIVIYLFQSKNVALGRIKYNVLAPKTMGHNDNFDRIMRVHQNTLEQMPIFLPLLWIFALTWYSLAFGWFIVCFSRNSVDNSKRFLDIYCFVS